MELYLYIAIVFYFGTILFLPFVLWTSKKNITFFQSLPFSIVAYFLGGIYFINFARAQYSIKDDILEFYTILLLVATIIFIIFYTWGFFSRGYIFYIFRKVFIWFSTENVNKFCSVGLYMAIITVILYIISFCGMGFIPLFAENPFAAKYMSGDYQEAYKNFAVTYRLALNLSNIAIAMLIIDFFIKQKKIINIILVILIIICLIFSMRRGMMLEGLLTLAFSYMAFQSKIKFVLLTIGYIVVVIIGSASNDIFLYTIGLRDALDITSIVRGAPDIADQLLFLKYWINDYWDITWGLNYLGALIPYHSEYNLAVITLNVIGSTAGEVASGGLRLPVPIISYISFGWLGVLFATAIYSYISGNILRLKKEVLKNVSIIRFIILNVFLFPYIFVIFYKIFSNGILLDNLVMFFIVGGIFIYSKKK